MATTFRFVASPQEGHLLLDWFSALSEPPEIFPRSDGVALFFRHLGPLVMTTTNQLDAERSPVVLLIFPQVRHEVLWTVAEVQFLAKGMTTSFPDLQKVLIGFRKWARTFPVVFRQPKLPEVSGGHWDYYLEGGIRNVSDEVFALPEGLNALELGRYFVWQGDSEGRLKTLLRMLKLRGVTNTEPCTDPNGRLGNNAT
jgi:hypothetical protein